MNNDVVDYIKSCATIIQQSSDHAHLLDDIAHLLLALY